MTALIIVLISSIVSLIMGKISTKTLVFSLNFRPNFGVLVYWKQYIIKLILGLVAKIMYFMPLSFYKKLVEEPRNTTRVIDFQERMNNNPKCFYITFADLLLVSLKSEPAKEIQKKEPKSKIKIETKKKGSLKFWKKN